MGRFSEYLLWKTGEKSVTRCIRRKSGLRLRKYDVRTRLVCEVLLRHWVDVLGGLVGVWLKRQQEGS